MTQPNRPPRPNPGPRKPAPQSSGSGVGRAVLIALGIGLLLVVVLFFMTRGGGGGGDGDMATPDTAIAEQLEKADYKKVNEEKGRSAEGDRDIVTQFWERTTAPEKVVISDDSPYTTPGVFIVRVVTYTGADGKGNLTCQPDPEHATSPLADILVDSDAVRAGIKDGSIKSDPENNPGGFPYKGEFMGCRP